MCFLEFIGCFQFFLEKKQTPKRGGGGGADTPGIWDIIKGICAAAKGTYIHCRAFNLSG